MIEQQIICRPLKMSIRRLAAGRGWWEQLPKRRG